LWQVEEHPPALVTVTLSSTEPALAADQVMIGVSCPAVIVPPSMDQLYVVPIPASATDAVFPVLPANTLSGAVMVQLGNALTVTITLAQAELPQEFSQRA
jgi:hypothetical protein